ncbi:MAG: hypothetical protein ACI8ZB_001390 [Desulforhopalus sp.]|jgi:hypothetical protein
MNTSFKEQIYSRQEQRRHYYFRVTLTGSGKLLQMLGNEAAADKSVGPKGELFDLKRKTPCQLRKSFFNYKTNN